jgi:hypothetical protein
VPLDDGNFSDILFFAFAKEVAKVLATEIKIASLSVDFTNR